jgi:hypothetical protein
MTNKVIIYPLENNSVAIVYPTMEFLELFTIEELAKKEVPQGKPHKIVNISEIPTDRTFRDAWEYQQ